MCRHMSDLSHDQPAHALLEPSWPDGRLQALADLVPAMIWCTAADGTTRFVNRHCLQFSGRSGVGNMGSEWMEAAHPHDLRRVQQTLLRAHENRTEFEIEFRVRRHDGVYRWLLARGAPQYSSEGEYCGFIGTSFDITDRKIAEERLVADALRDALTGLPNRALLLDRVERSMSRMSRNAAHVFAVLCLDLDRFKNINDSVGHGAGDELLVAFAKRLTAGLRPSDTVARLGGDEFAILLEEIKDQEDAGRVAQRVHDLLTRPFPLAGTEVFISASIGIAMSSQRYKQPQEILRDADIAMYRAKSLGKARSQVFDVAMHATAVDLLRLENDLRRAVDRGEFVVHYQPIVALHTGKIESLEALVRWKHPQRGMISPAEFIPVAEETGLIVQVGQIVLEESCRQLRRWHSMLPSNPPLTISVNLSARQFVQSDLVDRIMSALRGADLSPQFLRLEITESVLMADAAAAAEMLRRLKELKIQVSIDDFGTGYSSLGYLHRFPVDMIKVDRSFVSRMHEGAGDIEIVRAIVSLAHNLNMHVTAEGIETTAQLAMLQGLGCEYGQGYLYSRPVDADAISQLLREHHADDGPLLRMTA
jgi:diguanylate cyclase (GGDEF)-like protein/PAS domain S-box-containing protein